MSLATPLQINVRQGEQVIGRMDAKLNMITNLGQITAVPSSSTHDGGWVEISGVSRRVRPHKLYIEQANASGTGTFSWPTGDGSIKYDYSVKSKQRTAT